MDDIKKRLQETSEKCFTCYESWIKNKKDGKAREALEDSIHELRKVASRLEIEMAVSERTEATQKPLPIPPHRDAQRRPADDSMGNVAHDDDRGNFEDLSKGQGNRPPQNNNMQRRRPQQHSGGQRRPQQGGNDQG